MVGCKDYVHAQMGRKGNEQRRIFRQIVKKTSRILDNFNFFQPWWVGGPTVIIGLVSVQVELKLDLSTGT